MAQEIYYMAADCKTFIPSYLEFYEKLLNDELSLKFAFAAFAKNAPFNVLTERHVDNLIISFRGLPDDRPKIIAFFIEVAIGTNHVAFMMDIHQCVLLLLSTFHFEGEILASLNAMLTGHNDME